jgi:hypothetical protein
MYAQRAASRIFASDLHLHSVSIRGFDSDFMTLNGTLVIRNGMLTSISTLSINIWTCRTTRNAALKIAISS